MARTRVGEDWAYRERAFTPGGSVSPVEVLQHGPPRSKKVRVRWLGGEFRGLDEWVPEVRLIARWEEVGEFLEDERRLTELGERSRSHRDELAWLAVEQVWLSGAIGSASFDFGRGGDGVVRVDDFAGTRDLPVDADSLQAYEGSFVDRHWAFFCRTRCGSQARTEGV